QAELARQTERLAPKGTSPEGQRATEEARRKMTEAAKALEGAKSPAEAKGQLARAAEAAQELARQLEKGGSAKAPPKGPARTTSARPTDSPQKQAQDLARQQRELARAGQAAQQAAARQPGPEGKKALDKALAQLAGRQQELNKQASQLPAE